MPSWQWSYPYNSADTATVLFDASPADSCCHWRAPHRDSPQPRDVLVETLDGGVRSYRLGSAGRLIVLRFVDLPSGSASVATQLWGYTGMLEFLENHAQFGESTFGYFDHATSPTELEVRYAGGIDGFTVSRGLWEGEIVLREEIV